MSFSPYSQARSSAMAQSDMLLKALKDAPLSTGELAGILDMNSKTGALKRTIKELIEQQLIEYKLPDKPNSRLQKYQITEKGQELLKSLQIK